jgi:hypothetical protein
MTKITADAVAAAEGFIKDQQENYIKTTTDKEALEELGAGMHTLMDKTSPAHNGKNGPKPWGGDFGSNLVFVFYHFWAESNTFHLSEKRVKKAEKDIRNYYFESLAEKIAVLFGASDDSFTQAFPTPSPTPPAPAPAPTPPIPPPPPPNPVT